MQALGDLLLGIDCSTTASKALICDLNGSVVASSRCALPIHNPQPGWHEQPAGAWWTATVNAIQQASAQVEAKRLAGMCISHQRETLALVDSSGKPLRPAILWMDERVRSLLPELASAFSPGRFQQITGKPLTANLTASKIAWIKRNEPEVMTEGAMIVDVQAYLAGQLTGQFSTSWGSADPTGLFDMQQNCWSEEILAGLGLHKDQLPNVYPPGEVLGVIKPEVAETCGLPRGLPLVSGLGDGQAVGLGVNISQSNEAYLSLGTSVISGSISDQYIVSQAFRTMYSGIPGAYMLETVLLGGASTVRWFVENFPGTLNSQDISAEQHLERAAMDIPPGAGGLLLVPYWSGVMNPYWDARASGIVVGWHGHHTPAHLYRAILEGIAFELNLHLSGVEATLGREVERLIAVGGGANSNLWCQIIADVTGKPVYRTKTMEAAALGAAILGASGVGLFKDARQAAQQMAQSDPLPVEPRPDSRRYYQRLFEEVYQPLFPALQSSLGRLAEISDKNFDK